MLQQLPLANLSINRANDRHGELENETAAIAWLFNEREDHMRNLAKDIATKQRIFEPPLVSLIGGVYVVFDGNRRVTCLKLIENPRRAPTVPLQEFFDGLKSNWSGTVLTEIECQVETDRERIDDILFRRHTGSQKGIGRSDWDDRMKLNFVERTGREGPVNLAAEVEKLLESKGLLPTQGRIPRSNLNRLLSGENFRARVGFTARNRKIEFTHQEPIVLAALTRIANDLVDKKVVLGDLWDIDGKRRYLDSLEIQGVLPSANHALPRTDKPKSSSKSTSQNSTLIPPVGPNAHSPQPLPPAFPQIRDTLIPPVEYPIPWSGKTQRQQAIWNELQFELRLRQQPNAIAVLFRVLLELAIDNYVAAKGLVLKGDSLGHRFHKVVDELYSCDKISERYKQHLDKIRSDASLVSISTMNAYVHSSKCVPSPENAAALWDNLAEFIVQCLSE